MDAAPARVRNRMTSLTTVAAKPSFACRECKRMLRQQHAQTSMSGKSAELPQDTVEAMSALV